MEYIDTHREEFGVEPVCRELQIAPSTYYAAKSRPPSARSVRDAELTEVITVEHEANYSVYGARKMWKHLHRLGRPVARCTVERLMRAADLRGVVRGRVKRTTIPGKDGCRAGDLVNRAFTATAPNQLWVADFTYVRTWAGFTYVAFIVDVFSRMIIGWKADTTMRADLVIAAISRAAASCGKEGYPPKPTTAVGCSAARCRSACAVPATSATIPLAAPRSPRPDRPAPLSTKRSAAAKAALS